MKRLMIFATFVVAMLVIASGAVGAQKFLITSSGQIKHGSVSYANLSANAHTQLHGSTGHVGSNGVNGTNGTNGKDGAPGAQGPNGGTGATGAQGSAGKDGKDGKDGMSAPGVVVTHSSGPDSSVCGGNWANDDYTRTLQFIPQNDGTIQVVRTYKGTFTTIAGQSQPDPSGGCPGTLQTGGVTGSFTGYDVVVVTGGVFTPNATCADVCTTSAMLAAFFPGTPTAASAINNGWEYQYDAGTNGHWINRSAVRGGNAGNIVG